MRIQLERSGGFAGISRRADVETTRLPAAERAEIERLAQAVDLDHLPAPPPRPGADRFQYELSITDQGRRRSASFVDGQVTPAMRALIDRLLQLAG